MTDIATTKAKLMALCDDYEVFGDVPPSVYGEVDLIEHGLVDSMTTVYMQEMIKENFSLDLPSEIFVLELRSIDTLAAYVQNANP